VVDAFAPVTLLDLLPQQIHLFMGDDGFSCHLLVKKHAFYRVFGLGFATEIGC
jgi:hypothetical protein